MKGTVNVCHTVSDYDVSAELVDKIVQQLSVGKAAGIDGLTIEHLKYCHPIVIVLLAKLFNLMMRYKYVPNDFGIGLTVPIPKSGASHHAGSTADYRGITVSPVISKIFEHCLLTKYDTYLYSETSQFGFKKKTSVSHAIYALRQTVNYFVERDSTVNICSIDMSKAFDKINKYALFIKLMNRKCPIEFINLLDCWYSKSITCVRWNNVLSRYVTLSAGIRQGGVLSPMLFAVYVNDVLVKLHKSSLGCFIKSIPFNAFMYADDLLLLSISVCDMQRMVDICKTELDWLDMRINVSKTCYMRIGNRHNCTV